MRNRFVYDKNGGNYNLFGDYLDYITAKKFNILSQERRLVREILETKSGHYAVVVGFSRKTKGNQWHLIGYNKPKRPVFYCIFDEKYDNYKDESCVDFLDFFEENVQKAENYKELLKILEDK